MIANMGQVSDTSIILTQTQNINRKSIYFVFYNT